MSNSDHMRRLIDLAKGDAKTEPKTLAESSGSTAKDFARWGNVNEAWAGEPASEPSRVNVYQDTDPLGKGDWFWTRSVNGHIVASGSAPTEDEAEAAANMKECAVEEDSELMELSPETLKSYASKAADNAIDAGYENARLDYVNTGKKWQRQSVQDRLEKTYRTMSKRKQGLGKAMDRLQGAPLAEGDEEKFVVKLVNPQGETFYAGHKGLVNSAADPETVLYTNARAAHVGASYFHGTNNAFWNSERASAANMAKQYRGWDITVIPTSEAVPSEEVLVKPELDEGGKMNAAYSAGMPPFSDEEQSALAGYKAGGGPAEGVNDFIASLRNGTAFDELNEPVELDAEQQARVDAFLSNLDDMYNKHHGVDEAEQGDFFPADRSTRHIEVDTVTGPSYWASYLVNGDDSSLTPEEKAHADAWLERLDGYEVVGIADDESGESQEPRFSNHFDIHSGTDTRGGDVVDYVVHKIAREGLEEADGAGIHVDYIFDIDDIPEHVRDECISDCSGQGNVGDAVEYWVDKLGFTVNRDRAIQCLAGYGSDTREELAAMDDEDIAKKIFWLACCNFAEWDGDEEGNSSSGSPQFVLE